MGKGEGVLLSLWLCDVDGTYSGDGTGYALICNNNKNIINNEIISYIYIYIYIYINLIMTVKNLHKIFIKMKRYHYIQVNNITSQINK